MNDSRSHKPLYCGMKFVSAALVFLGGLQLPMAGWSGKFEGGNAAAVLAGLMILATALYWWVACMAKKN